MCGKNVNSDDQSIFMKGSHPRVREKPVIIHNAKAPTGITPACAGKTKTQTAHTLIEQDHPRVCGKNVATC